ncbi:MAG: hypothetical protein DRQ89_15470, partial [Epsilonproteobacteria bacterium]
EQVIPISHTAIEAEMEEWLGYKGSLWDKVLGSFNFVSPTVPGRDYAPETEQNKKRTVEQSHKLGVLLYHMSPWLLRWKGIQLPVELTIGEPGSGKAQPLNAKVLTPTGWALMGEIQVGDEVLTPQGDVEKVVAVHPQGVKPIYGITFTDGSYTECCDEHQWKVQSTNDRMHASRHARGLGHMSGHGYRIAFWRQKSLKQIRDNPLRYGGNSTHKFHNYIPLVQQLNFVESSSMPLDPYVMGALLGDGSFRTAAPGFTSEDAFIIKKVGQHLPTGCFLRLSNKIGYCIDYRIYGGRKNRVRKELKNLGLWELYSHTKFIPDLYLWGSYEQRLSLLQGLMDTDGTAVTAGSGVYNTSSTQLAHGVQHLVRSLGGRASISERTAPLKKGNRLAYNVHIGLPIGICPFTLPYKVKMFEGCKHQHPHRAIKNVEYKGRKEAQCITISGDDGLYLTDDFIVTHNSSTYELRQTIITGAPRLSNMSNDIKDWYAGITSRGGLFVLDNVHFTGASKDYQQRLSDELCRITTEPNPHVEMRKLYTNADVINLPVTTTFALTSIEQPFFTTDLIQRSAIFELQAIQTGHDADWVGHQLSYGKGRIGWVAHQLTVIHKFLHLAQTKWDEYYKAGHRLKHYEQALMLMAEVIGMDSEWIPGALKKQTATKMTETDWTMAGLEIFVQEFQGTIKERRFSVKDITNWALDHEIYSKNATLINGWKLGKYMKGHRGLLQKTIGAFEDGSSGNRQMYSVAGA